MESATTDTFLGFPEKYKELCYSIKNMPDDAEITLNHLKAIRLLDGLEYVPIAITGENPRLELNNIYQILGEDIKQNLSRLTEICSSLVTSQKAGLFSNGLVMVKIKDYPDHIPIKVSSSSIFDNSANKLTARLYKMPELLGNILAIPLDIIEYVYIVPLGTLRGFKRHQKYKFNTKKSFSSTDTFSKSMSKI